MKTGYEVNQIKRKVRKDERQKVIAEVLEIIDEESTRNGLNLKQTAEIRRRVVELKGGDEE